MKSRLANIFYDLLDFTVTAPASPPVLNISEGSPDSFNLVWAESSAAFILESCRSLEIPVSWQPVTNSITIVNGTNYLTINSGDNSSYFRLEQLP